jgi:hypothetical protein
MADYPLRPGETEEPQVAKRLTGHGTNLAYLLSRAMFSHCVHIVNNRYLG